MVYLAFATSQRAGSKSPEIEERVSISRCKEKPGTRVPHVVGLVRLSGVSYDPARRRRKVYSLILFGLELAKNPRGGTTRRSTGKSHVCVGVTTGKREDQ